MTPTRGRPRGPSQRPLCAPPKPRKRRNSGEELKQTALFKWAVWIRIPSAPDIEPGAKVSDYLFAIPNGGSRNKIEAAKMKASGVKAGVWDLMLPIARQGFNGLWVEMKHGKNGLTDKQQEWGDRMRLAGYKTVTAWTSYEAETAIADYLGIKIY